MDETAFKMFENFDFENNQHFQAGWKSIEKLIDPTNRESEYLRAQTFFFSKNVMKFDYQEYLMGREVKQSEQVRSEVGESESRENIHGPGPDPTEHEENQDKSILSLAEVAELIQNNQPIPGLISLDVKPSNAEPTPSTMIRKLKPWEMTEVGITAPESQQPVTSGNFSDAVA